MESQAKHEGKQNFNKKKWRETQYSHKPRVSEWENKRKQAVTGRYRKMLKKEETPAGCLDVNKLYGKVGDSDNAFERPPKEYGRPTQSHFRQSTQRLSEYQKAKLEYERIQQLKQEKRQEREQRQKEREEAICKSKQVRLERIRKLTKKTKKGQPVMKGRIEILLEKIKKQVANDS